MSDLIFIDLEIKNFKSFRGDHKLDLDRPPGLYYVTGKNKLAPELGANGIGKTALTADALMWVLFNKTERDSRPADAIQPWGDPKACTQISLWFKRLGKVKIIRRTRNPNSLELLHPKTDTVVHIDQKAIPEIIGMSEEMFRRTVVLGQFGSLFLDLRPEEQSRLFNEALDLDIWLRASEVAGQNSKIAVKRISTLEGEMARLEGAGSVMAEQEKAARAKSTEWKEGREEEIKALEIDMARMKKTLYDGYKTLQEVAGAKDGPRPGPEALVDLMSRQRASWRELAQRQADIRSELGGLDRQELDLRAQAREYKKALDGNLTCPTCGQKAPKKHLEEKAAAIENKLSDLATRAKVKDKEVTEVSSLLTASERQGELYRCKEKTSEQLSAIIRQKKERLDILTKQNVNPFLLTVTDLQNKLAANKRSRKEALDAIDQAEGRIKLCEFWQDGYKEIRLSLIDAALDELQLAATRHAELLGLEDWLIKFDTERMTQAGNISAAFTIRLWPPGQEEAIKFESYSGGESQRLQLAIAFGLSEVILGRAGVSPNIEVLDEPTRGLSAEGVEDLLEHLADRAQELDRSIYVIEHHSLERGAFAGTIMIEKTAEGSAIVVEG